MWKEKQVETEETMETRVRTAYPGAGSVEIDGASETRGVAVRVGPMIRRIAVRDRLGGADKMGAGAAGCRVRRRRNTPAPETFFSVTLLRANGGCILARLPSCTLFT